MRFVNYCIPFLFTICTVSQLFWNRVCTLNVLHVRVIYDLTPVSPVYSEDPVVHQKAASLNLLVYSQTDPVLSGVRGLISELKPEQHNLYL